MDYTNKDEVINFLGNVSKSVYSVNPYIGWRKDAEMKYADVSNKNGDYFERELADFGVGEE